MLRANRRPAATVQPGPYAVDKLPRAPGRRGLRIATWNINSVRLRLPLIRRLIEAAAPDILCLQETKAEDVHFPTQALAELGFEHQMISGMKGYNGVAILSRRELRSTGTRSWCEKNDSRHVHADIDGGIELHCVYVPAGGDIPDPDANSKFAHKLRFVREQAEWWARQPTRAARRLLVGDLNIAPLENDVWSHKQLLDVVSHTPIEVDLLRRMQEAHGWVDAVRYFAPEPQRLYTWWSYRNRDWQASDRGRRLDHIWVTPALVPNLRAVHIFKGARDWPTPSDHVPVVVDLRL